MTLKRQISSEMMDSIQTVELGNLNWHGEKVAELFRFMVTIELIQDLGWFEHTSDWDPFLVISFNNADTQALGVTASTRQAGMMETESGYAEFQLSADGKDPLSRKEFRAYLGMYDSVDGMSKTAEEIEFILVDDCDYESNERITHVFRIDEIKSILIER